MSTSQRHIIGRIVLELETTDSGDSWALQSELSELLQGKAAAAVEQLLSQKASANEVIRLDQVAVELPPFSSQQQLIDDFVPRLIVALSEALDQQLGLSFAAEPLSTLVPTSASTSEVNSPRFDTIKTTSASSNTTESTPTDFESPSVESTGVKSNDLNLASSNISKQSKSVQDVEWEGLIYFLTYGRFPWWQETLPFSDWVARWETVLQKDNIAWRQSLKQCLYNSVQSRERFVHQLPAPFCHQLIVQIQPNWTTWPVLIEEARSLTQQINAQYTTPPFSISTLHYLEQQAWLAMLSQITLSTSASAAFPTQSWISIWLTSLVDALRASSRSAASANNVANEQQEIFLSVRSAIANSSQSNPSIWLTAVDSITSQAASGAISYPTINITEDKPSPDALITKAVESRKNCASEETVTPNNIDDAALTTADVKTIEDTTVGTNVTDTAEISPTVTNASQQSRLEERDQGTTSSSETIESDLETALPIATQSVESLHPLTNNPPKQSASSTTLSPDERANGIYLNHAGLVILHPFLTIYFEDIGLLENSTFKHEYAQQQAIALLHYMSTGETNTPEHEMVFPKLLCGWPLNEPIDTSLSLPPSALQEADKLLSVIINYWDALKNTTPEGLREGFLQRPGKLTHSDGWKLQVEQQAIDILLSRLPWGISMVKLPWMIDVLVVEWT